MKDILDGIKSKNSQLSLSHHEASLIEKQFFTAVRVSDLETIEECLKIDPNLIKAKDVKSRSALQLAAQRGLLYQEYLLGYKELIILLLDYKPPIDSDDNIITTSIKSAKKNNFHDIVQILKNYEKLILEN